MGIKDYESNLRPDIESLRTGMISALVQYTFDTITAEVRKGIGN